MKKRHLLLFALLLLLMGAMYAQNTSYTYGFENNNMEGWTVTSLDDGSTTWRIGHKGYNPSGESNEVYTSSSGDYYIGSVYDKYNNVDDWLISPQIMLGGTMTYYVKTTSTSYDDEEYVDYLTILLSRGTTDTDQFTPLETYRITNTNYGSKFINLSAYSGLGYIAFRHTAGIDQASLLIDDITIVQPLTYNVQVGAEPIDGGTVTGDGTFIFGYSCTVTASANNGYTFTNWTENGSVVSTNASYTFNVNSNRTLVAHFALNPPTDLTINNITSTSAKATWTANGASSWMYRINNDEWTSTTTHNADLTDLTPNQEYTFEVKAISGLNESSVASTTFTTMSTHQVKISVNPSHSGRVIHTDGSWSGNTGTYDHNTSCTLTALPEPGYTFTNWTENGTVVFDEAIYTFTVTANRDLVANFTQNPTTDYSVSVLANPINGGTVTGGGTYQQGQSCTVIATAANDYKFINWTVDGTEVSTAASYTFTVTESMDLVANFELNTYAINVVADPAEGGTVDGAGNYTHGDVIHLTATANAHFTFVGWYEGETLVSEVSNPNNILATHATTYTAHFQIQSYTIHITANNNAYGEVEGGGDFIHGQRCTVSATAFDGYTFDNWTENGDEVSQNANYSFSVESNRSLVANFSILPPDTYNINVSANPREGGTVTGSGNYQEGQNCTVTATAANGYKFINWTEGDTEVSLNTEYSFAVERNRTLVANFELNNYEITATANPDAGGTITGTGSYNHLETCTLTATANDGYAFDNWTENGDQVSTNANFTFIVERDRNLVANFSILPQDTYYINVSAYPSECGTVTGSGNYQEGQNCTVTATASNGYIFLSWTENDTVVSTDAVYQFIVTNNRTLVATFQKEICIDDIQEIVAKEHTEGHETYILMLVYPNVDSLGNPINEEYTYQWHYSKNGESYSDLKEGTYDKQYYYIGGRLAEGYYKVRISKDGCSSYEETQPYCVNYDNRLIIYPNPSRRGDNVIVANPCDGPAQLAIYSTDGRLLHSQMLTDSQATINIQLSLGVYVAYITNSEGYTKIGKLIIQ